MPDQKEKKSFATLAEDLRKLRKRVPTARQIKELNSALQEPKTKDTPRKKIARPFETEA